jgi:hypothetical protein
MCFSVIRKYDTSVVYIPQENIFFLITNGDELRYTTLHGVLSTKMLIYFYTI